MPNPIRIVLTGPNLPRIEQPRPPAPSTITKKTLADFVRALDQLGVLKAEKPG